MNKIFTIALSSLLGGLSLSSQAIEFPFFNKQGAAANRTKAIGHSKQIMLAMFDFELEYGTRPGAATLKLIPGAKSATSNDCFRQLLQGLATVRTEAIFYAHSKISKKPDNAIGKAENDFLQACAKGEVGFVYIDAPDSKAGAPLVAAPLLDAKTGKFDHKAYGGKAVILMTDGAVITPDIDPESGKIFIKIGDKKVDLLSKENPAFRTAPNIKYPEPK